MDIKKFKLSLPSLFLVSALMAFIAINVAYAANLTSVGQIQIVKAIKIEEVQRLNFGKIEKPTQTVDAAISLNGTTSGSATFIDTSEVAIGIFEILGSDTESVNIKVTPMNNGPYMGYNKMEGKYGSTNIANLFVGGANLQPPGNGVQLDLAGSLKIRSTVPEGLHEPAFSREVNYD